MAAGARACWPHRHQAQCLQQRQGGYSCLLVCHFVCVTDILPPRSNIWRHMLLFVRAHTHSSCCSLTSVKEACRGVGQSCSVEVGQLHGIHLLAAGNQVASRQSNKGGQHWQSSAGEGNACNCSQDVCKIGDRLALRAAATEACVCVCMCVCVRVCVLQRLEKEVEGVAAQRQALLCAAGKSKCTCAP
jgi:hypothetical protein